LRRQVHNRSIPDDLYLLTDLSNAQTKIDRCILPDYEADARSDPLRKSILRGICLTQVTPMGSVQGWWRNTRET